MDNNKTAIQKMLDGEPVSMTDPTYGEAGTLIAETWKKCEEIKVHGNNPDEVRQDKEGLQIMRTLGQNMAWMLKCIEAGKQLGITPPVYEDFTPTNFIR
jgi:hypothetical protein